jgi:hypothetical protein
MKRLPNGDVHWAALLKTQRDETEAAACVTPRQYLTRSTPQAVAAGRRPDPLACPLDQWDSPRRPVSAAVQYVAPGTKRPATAASKPAPRTPSLVAGAAMTASELDFHLARSIELLRRTADPATLPAVAVQKMQQIAAFAAYHAELTAPPAPQE